MSEQIPLSNCIELQFNQALKCIRKNIDQIDELHILKSHVQTHKSKYTCLYNSTCKHTHSCSHTRTCSCPIRPSRRRFSNTVMWAVSMAISCVCRCACVCACVCCWLEPYQGTTRLAWYSMYLPAVFRGGGAMSRPRWRQGWHGTTQTHTHLCSTAHLRLDAYAHYSFVLQYHYDHNGLGMCTCVQLHTIVCVCVCVYVCGGFVGFATCHFRVHVNALAASARPTAIK